ncbi:MAG: protoheme IX farnesyltransferase [Anaerolineae bacterium]|nr:protoheme IX farnesyltransferase [Anaerolineae bacterium]
MAIRTEQVSAPVFAPTAAPRAFSLRHMLSLIVVLFKLRIVVLLLAAAWGGAMLASSGRPGMGSILLLTLTGALAAGGSGAINQYLERDQDTLMKRTRRRPLATGEIKPVWALLSGSGAIGLALLLALLAGNPTLAFFLGIGAFIYIGVYTVWLKPRTLLNVVIGGAAGSAAVLSGSAAVGNWAAPGALLLAALLFTWSPSHFWSLALVYRKDYANASFPMLPVVMERRRAVIWTLIHMAATGAIGLLLATDAALGWLYFVPMAAATLWLTRDSIQLLRAHQIGSEGQEGQQAMTLFKASNIYLALVLLMICVTAPL